MKRTEWLRPLPLLVMLASLVLLLSITWNTTLIGAQNDTGDNLGPPQFGTVPYLTEYFTNTTFGGDRIIGPPVNQINFQFGNDQGPNVDGVSPVEFSVRYRASQPFAAGGLFRFTVRYIGSVRLVVDGNVLINESSGADLTVAVTAIADLNVLGPNADILLEYVKFNGQGVVQLSWQSINAGQPTATPGPPTATALPPIPPGALTATVIDAAVLRVRRGPSTGNEIIARIQRGQTYQVIGRNEDATWFLLQLSGLQGWAYGFYLFFNRNEFSAPIVESTTAFDLPAGFSNTGVIIQTKAGMKLRAEPNLASMQTGRIVWGSLLPVAGRTADGQWYYVLWRGTPGWMFADFSDIVEGDFNQIPVIR